MENKHLDTAVSILKKIHYINIATVCEDGSPWNTPVSASYDDELSFFWGSSPENTHSNNILRDSRVFITIYDSTAPEGMGEAVYMSGKAKEVGEINNAIKKYCFVPENVWVNDEAKNSDGSYKHDIRIELDIDSLRRLL